MADKNEEYKRFNCLLSEDYLEVAENVHLGLDISIESEEPSEGGTVIVAREDIVKLRDHLNGIIDREGL